MCCLVITPCASSPCLHGGTCTVTGDPLIYKCTCTLVGFAGTNCEIGTQPTCPSGAQLGLPTWEQDGLEPGFQVGSKWVSPFIKKISFTYALS